MFGAILQWYNYKNFFKSFFSLYSLLTYMWPYVKIQYNIYVKKIKNKNIRWIKIEFLLIPLTVAHHVNEEAIKQKHGKRKVGESSNKRLWGFQTESFGVITRWIDAYDLHLTDRWNFISCFAFQTINILLILWYFRFFCSFI